MAPGPNLLLPLKLDAFILNPSVCDGKSLESKIAPITQPNYTYLRIDQKAARTDVLPHVDLHLSSPSTTNPRVTNLSTRKPRPERQGVYLHWTLPKLYRSGVASATQDQSSTSSATDGQATGPEFPLVPNRWMVVRRLRPNTFTPSNAVIPSTEAWIVQSDRRYRIDELGQHVDLQTDVSPFMDVRNGQETDPLGNVSITDQAEIFIGSKTRVSEWKESDDGSGDNSVKLHILASSNPLFADYQPHNSNVFSILDTFSYNEVKDDDGNIISQDRLTKATADYYVMGWHSNVKDDILYSHPGDNRRERLLKLSLNLPEALADSTSWLNMSDAARIICHGAMYEVNWDVATKPRTPADDWSLNMNQKQQVSVGTSAIDALLAYVSAHHGDKPSDPKNDSTKDIRQLEEDIFNLRAYLRMQENTSVEAYRKATDSLMHLNYSRSSGGTQFTFPVSRDPQKPDKDDLANLRTLNNAQRLLDASLRSLKHRRWELFSLWFKHFSTADTSIQASPKDVQDAQDRYDALVNVVTQQTAAVEEAKKKVGNAIEAVHPEYYQQGDPTIMVGGVRSGWAHDFLDKVKVRLDSQTIQASDDVLSTINLNALQNRSIPPGVWEVMVRLLGEFCSLGSNDDKSTDVNQMPLYHDTGVEDADSNTDNAEAPLWRDRWNNRQPWFPLFVEWEAEYVHVPWEDWILQKSVSGSSGLERTSYRIASDKDLTSIKDRRLVSGRILILPQPSFALNALIQQLFSTVPKDELESIISKEEQDNLSKNVLRLPFLSAPLSGLTDHLITLAHGTHIKPSVRARGQGPPQPVTEAVDKGPNPMFSKDRIAIMGLELDPTPYGAQIHVAAADDSPSPFKPVTHGQLRFTKLNVIDKFGQAIHALQPRTSAVTGPIDGVTPCVGEFYEVSSKPPPTNPTGAGISAATAPVEAHTAGKDDVNGLSEFIQLPPSINQPARLNAHFVTRESTTDPKSGWRPTTEWEDPIWGWIVVNYIDYGIQLFTAKGVFYREVRLPGSGANGRTGGVASAKWLPFKKTDEAQQPGATAQLDKLIEQLTAKDGVYLQAFMDMINGALKQSGPAPGEYAEALTCIVGKPLALVNMGWSLELATPPTKNQSTINGKDPERHLIDPNDQSEADDFYQFPIKLGDSHREYDGLVGYFPMRPRSTNPKDVGTLPLNDEFDLTRLYTYFGHEDKPQSPGTSYPLVQLNNTTYPRLSPHWHDPAKYQTPNNTTSPLITPPPTIASTKYTRDVNAKLAVFAAVLDPFQPVHAYSSFLPIKELKLLDWTWQRALNNMTAFFHVGPLMVTGDVPAFEETYRLRADYYALGGKKEVYEKETVDVLPAGGVSEWNWLQPYYSGGTGGEEKIKFMPIKVGRMDTRPRFEKGPYAALEGYLQMRRGIVDRGG
ncbi:hypothetical protein QBC41DRAFT_279504 [Cercophora samala]|uniref:Uncharacterized protein n=1 Tax=Cercophora samala TaxID=330535 RepID=A0AA39ZA96_9PEZI|nr:hypothetical protein QBC41DRAFT_279504 [Cercophora samala]